MRRPTRQAAFGAAGIIVLTLGALSAGTAAVAVVSMTPGERALAGEFRTRDWKWFDPVVTAEQIRAARPDVDDTWIAQSIISAKCMVGKNFYLDPRKTADAPDYVSSGAEYAEKGDSPVGKEYDWQRAGCWGFALHVTGNDPKRPTG